VAVNDNALVIPGKATVFHAPKNTALPANPLTAFNLGSNTVATGWRNLGHTSKDNTVAFSRDGGDSTSIDTYLADSVRTIYSSVSWSLAIPALQFDEDVLDLAFNGDFAADGGYIIPGSATATDAALFLLFQDGTGKLGFYIPATSVTLAEPPSFSPESFIELPLSASIQSAASTAIPAVNGVPGIMKLYKSGLTAGV
jgi:hypothetical protein